jgi:alpha-tubulin suppressor-like RCC1 family protein
MSTCAVTTSNAAYCWGDNSSGQLGTGTSTASTTPVAVTGAHSFTSVSAGRFHACGLATDGKAFCWGNDGAGQLGAPTRTTCTDAFARTVGCSLVPLAVSGGLTFTSLVSGDDHTCALTSAGTVYCWGSNGVGELGNGTQTTTDIPTQVAGGLHFMSLSAAGANTCGLTSAGAAYCWGSNAYGQLGTGSTSDFSSSPVLVSGGMTFESISTGSNHSCGVTASHVAYCWGSNSLGQHGTGDAKVHLVPQVAVSTP